jgi:alpha-galactosidase
MQLLARHLTAASLVALGWLTNTPSLAGAESFWLSSIHLETDQDWGDLRKDRSVDNHSLSIGGQSFERGLGTHANSTLRIALNGKAEQFLARVGVDDEVGRRGSVTFRISSDDKILWESSVLRGGDPPQTVSVNLRGVSTLILSASDAGDGIEFDHANWADARIVMTRGRPQAALPPAEHPKILTPKPSRKPRINGAKVFGARPGSPFLFTIAATGQRPMTFSAQGLPSGLQLDPNTGRITGAVKNEGEYPVTLRAQNSRGKAERALKIICGPRIGLTPALGWNSWNCFASAVSGENVKAAADAMVKSGLINHGWSYINIDDFWQVHRDSKDPTLQGPKRDSEGRILPNPRFPDMKRLADYVHERGLRIGIYSSPGPWTCGGCVGSWQHEEQDAKQYAEWGFDYLKYDWCSYGEVIPGNWETYSRNALQQPYRVMRDALDKVPRDILFSLCQYGAGNVWEWGAAVGGNSWRTTGDIVDTWSSMSRIGFNQAGHEPFAGPGHFNDPDMLVVGKVGWGPRLHPTRLTPNEQYTHISLWCLLASPLLIGCDMTQLDEFTLSLLTNDEVLEVNQDPLGRQAARVARIGQLEVWAKDMEDGSKAVGLFNRGEKKAVVTAKWSDLGLAGKHKVRDLWRQKNLGIFINEYHTSVPRHGVVLLKISPAGQSGSQNRSP